MKIFAIMLAFLMGMSSVSYAGGLTREEREAARAARDAAHEAAQAARDSSEDAFDSAVESWEDGGQVGPRPRRSQF